MPKKDFGINYFNIKLNEYYSSLQWEKPLDQKMDYIAHVVLSYGFNDKKADCSLEDLIYFSKKQMAEGIDDKKVGYEYNNNVDDFDHTDLEKVGVNDKEYDKRIKLFLKEPVKCLEEIAQEYANKEIDETDQEQVKWKEHCSKMVQQLGQIEESYKDYETNKGKTKFFVERLNAKMYYGKAKSLDDIIDKHKGGFFERFFRRTSNEYKNYVKALKNYNDENNKDFGNDEKLKEATIAYLLHKFPNKTVNDEIKGDDLQTLDDTSRKRVNFCLDTLSTISYNKKLDKVIEPFNNLSVPSESLIDDKQSEFQKELSEKVEDIKKDDNLIEDVNENKDEPIKENEV